MSLNWVMMGEGEGFVYLPNERLIYTSPPRTSLSLQPLSSYKGKDTLSVQSNAGCIYLTNQRIVYLPAQKTKDFQSFSAPLLNVLDSHVSAPFFGPNVWTSLVQPVSGGGIPSSLPAVQLKVTFKEGGAFDFHTNFERIKERLQQAVENTQEAPRGQRSVDLTAVHLDELPAYDGRRTSPDEISSFTETRPESHGAPPVPPIEAEPLEPPPGYEEVQQQSIAELDESMRRFSTD